MQIKNTRKTRTIKLETAKNMISTSLTTVFILLVRKANAKGSVSGFEIASPSKGGGSDKHLGVN